MKLIAKQLNLKKRQIYKWFWDTKKRINEISETNERGMSGKGKILTQGQIKNALRINQDQRDNDIDCLAAEL